MCEVLSEAQHLTGHCGLETDWKCFVKKYNHSVCCLNQLTVVYLATIPLQKKKQKKTTPQQTNKHFVARLHYCACRICVDSVRLPCMCVFARLAACICVHACLPTIWAHTLSCQGSAQLIFMHSVTSPLQTLLNILFPWAFHCCLVSEINMYEARRWEFLIDLRGPALLFNICLGLLVPAQWR